MVLQVPPAYTTPILTIDYYQSKSKSRFTITKYASGVPECRRAGATPSASHGRRVLLLTHQFTASCT